MSVSLGKVLILDIAGCCAAVAGGELLVSGDFNYRLASRHCGIHRLSFAGVWSHRGRGVSPFSQGPLGNPKKPPFGIAQNLHRKPRRPLGGLSSLSVSLANFANFP
jgi:hypothetical protein